MALDPKYASLPWIAHDQPDVFETSDLPEADQNPYTPEELNSESVENVQIKADDAVKKFDGKPLDADSVDFSDKISKSRRIGYGLETDEYGIVGPDEKSTESPVQKFQRLQAEIRLLVDEVQQVSEQVKVDTAQPITPGQLAQLAEGLQGQLAEFQLTSMVGPDAKVDLSDPNSSVQKRLFQHIEGFQPSKKGSKKDDKSPESNRIVYELYHQPEVAKHVEQSKLADLDQRIQRVEALLGNNPSKVSALTADTANRSLLESVSKLCARSALLEPGHLDQVEARLGAMHQRLQSITEKKEVIADADTQNKIADLYELVKKWDSVSDALPTLVDRLTALKELHEQAMQFTQALNYLDTNQQQVTNSLKSHQDMVKQLQTSLQQSLDTIKGSVNDLDGRMKKLGK